MSNHTKGPWFKGNTSNHEIMILGGASRNYVCHVTIQQTGGGLIAKSMESEREANAKLIGASPDLLAALEAALPLLESCAQTHLNGDKIYKQALDALAKAKGGTDV